MVRSERRSNVHPQGKCWAPVQHPQASTVSPDELASPPLPAVAPPPGLEGLCAAPLQTFMPPPGLPLASIGPPEDAEAEKGQEDLAMKSVCHVRISGLPNKLLSEVMLEAVLEQAGLAEAVTNIASKKSIVKGKTSGETVVSLASFDAAERCLFHFQGCQWDCSGADVECEMLPLESGLIGAVEDVAACIAQMGEAWMMCDEFYTLAWNPEVFGQDMTSSTDVSDDGVQDSAAAFPPLTADAPVFVPAASIKDTPLLPLGGFSADAPVFVPAKVSSQEKEVRKLSDASTELAESGTDEEDEHAFSEDDGTFIGSGADVVAEFVAVF